MGFDIIDVAMGKKRGFILELGESGELERRPKQNPK